MTCGVLYKPVPITMSAASDCQDSSLSYELLLKLKISSEQCSKLPKIDDDAATISTEEPDATISTEEPETPCNSSVVESLAFAVPTKNDAIILRNVAHGGSVADARMEGLVRQVTELSELVFDEDCLTKMTKKSGWKLSLCLTNDYSVLCGFAVTKVTNGGALSIAKIAVPVEFRGIGFGKLLMEDAIKNAKKQGGVYEVCLSSLSTAVTFYQRLGFKAFTGVKVETDFEVVEGQVYMVKKLRPRPRGK